MPSLRDAGPPKRSVASFGVGVCMRRYRAVGKRDTEGGGGGAGGGRGAVCGK